MEEGMLAPLSVANWSVFLNCMNEQNYDLNVLVLYSGGFEKNPSREPEMTCSNRTVCMYAEYMYLQKNWLAELKC